MQTSQIHLIFTENEDFVTDNQHQQRCQNRQSNESKQVEIRYGMTASPIDLMFQNVEKSPIVELF